MLQPRFHTPLASLSDAILYRANVEIPPQMAEHPHHVARRIVFFEVPVGVLAGQHLQALLAIAWCIDTSNWISSGQISDIWSDSDFQKLARGHENTGDLRYFEQLNCSSELAFDQPMRIKYVQASEVDLMTSPRVKTRLTAALSILDDVV